MSKDLNKRIKILDSTLRDGAQAGNISFSISDKLNILKQLDEIGVSYVEAGNPGSNAKDKEFFIKAKEINLKNAKLAAFGSTRRKDKKAKDDTNIKHLLSAETDVIVIFGKSWDFHVLDIIQTTLDENVNMIFDTVEFFKKKGKEVIYDAEHFFDGYKANRQYAMRTVDAAVKAGADCIVLCDTNGGCFPDEIFEMTKEVHNMHKCEIGIHCHNDTGMAEANSIMAVLAGGTHVQGTFVGIGERCGNANISTIAANLQLKRGCSCIAPEGMQALTRVAKYIAEVANIRLSHGMPYVGDNAFAHKGGMHIDGVTKASDSFEHISPESVGNQRRFLMSEVAGKNTILSLVQKIDPSIKKESKEAQELIDILKKQEHLGYQYEGAEASFEMIIRKHLGKHEPFFDLEYFKIIEEEARSEHKCTATAMIKIKVNGEEEMTATEGNGPVNALDKAIRKALEVFFPVLKEMRLTDYKVRVIDQGASASKVRVLIESSDGVNTWNTVGVSTNIVEASMEAMIDAIEYKLTISNLR